jgi:hypothetical protein
LREPATTDFPTFNPIGGKVTNPIGNAMAFVTKLSPDGVTLLYSTYLGGSNNYYTQNYGRAIAIDSTGAVYVTGNTTSTNFPNAGGIVLQVDQPGAFIAKLSPVGAGPSLLYSTTWGGASHAFGMGIAVDRSGYVYVTGGTIIYAPGNFSTDYPITPGMRLCHVNSDTFVLKFAPGSATPAYSTCLGAPGQGDAIAVDATGNAYITGVATSEFPITAGAFQPVNNASPNQTGFVVELNQTGVLTHSTYLGGNDGSTVPEGIAINCAGEVYVIGYTTSTTFPLAPPIIPNPYAGFLAKLTPQLNALDYVTFLGAQINGVAIYQSYSRFGRPTYPKVYVAGYRYSGSISLGEDAFVSMLDEGVTTICCAAIP